MNGVRDLSRFLNPASIAIIGASSGTEKVGGMAMATLLGQDYAGRVYPVNAKGGMVHGLTAFSAIAELPEVVDLAFLCIPAAAIPDAVEECATRGIRNLIIASSGFADAGEDGERLQAQVLESGRRHGLNIAGPNAEGYYNVPARIAATFSPAVAEVDPGPTVRRRRVGVVAQSGGLAYGFYNKGRPRGLDFSCVIAIGNQADLEAADYIDALVADPDTAVILAYLEGIATPSRFLAAAARAADAGKPLVVARTGESEAGRRAVASHTGSLAGSRSTWNAVCERYGIIRASGPEEMLDLALAFTRYPPPKGDRLAVITVSGGTAAWIVDICAGRGITIPAVDGALQAALTRLLPSYGAASNPIDMAGHGNDSLAPALTAVLPSDDFDAVVIVVSLAFDRRLRKEGEALATIIRASAKPVLLYTYTKPSESSLALLEGWDLPLFDSMEGLARALAHAVDHARFLERWHPQPTPKPVPTSLPALEGPDPSLCEYEAKDVLAAYGIAAAPEWLVDSPAAAIAAAGAISGPVVLKIQSPQIPHKTEAGGIRLGLETDADVAAAFEEIIANAIAHAPGADIRGVLVQPMATAGIEMIVGVADDPEFGPMVMCGSGGVHVEVFGDVAFAPAPLNQTQAGALIGKLRADKLLDGFRGHPPADRTALIDLLVKVSHLADDLRGQIAEIDLNPVIVHRAGHGLSIVDALIVKREPGVRG